MIKLTSLHLPDLPPGTGSVTAPPAPPVWRHRDRLSLTAPPYSVVGQVGALVPGKLKRYVHVAPHAEAGARAPGAGELLRAVCAESGISAQALSETLALWEDLESSRVSGFEAGAIQLRPGAGALPQLEAKAYLRPVRRAGMGLRPAAMVLSRAVAARMPAQAETLRQELLRREAVDEIFYLAAAMRPDLELETYHDCEDRRPDFVAREISAIAARMVHHRQMAARAAHVVDLAVRAGHRCDHFSCDLWPVGGGGISLALSPARPRSADRSAQVALVNLISGLEGCLTPRVSDPQDLVILPGYHPGVVAVKIEAGAQGVQHRVFVEDVDPDFDARL